MENKFVALLSWTLSTLICMTGNLESYRRVSSKLKLETFDEQYTENIDSVSTKSEQTTGDAEAAGQVKTSEKYQLVFLSQFGVLFSPISCSFIF